MRPDGEVVANIRTKETGRHYWIPRYVFLPQEDDCDSKGMVRRIHCENCRMVARDDGSAPVAGCVVDIRIKNLGRDSASPYLEAEARELKRQEAIG